MVRLLHEGVCWLLSAVLLLNNGWPVAIRHSHDVGGNPYSHSHRIDRAAASPAIPVVNNAEGAVAGVTDHVHMLWLGWEVVVLPPKGCRPSPCPSATASGMLAQHVEKNAHDRFDWISSNVQALTACTAESISSACAVWLESDSIMRVAALPLCETARHLRSGVQLA
ncbi:MAG TPA: hypothetical protein VHC22_27870 [Pirellulales bacterium]|nr:hypothetical protein [Pirellulales bacterium]